MTSAVWCATAIWGRQAQAVVWFALVWTAPLMCLAVSPEKQVHFSGCHFIDVPRVYRLLQIEFSKPDNANIKAVNVACREASRVDVQVIGESGESFHRTLMLVGHEDDDLERILTLALAEAVAEAREAPDALPKSKTASHSISTKHTISTSASSDKKPELNRRAQSTWTVGAQFDYQHMRQLGALGPGVTLHRGYSSGLGWQWDVSVLFARDDTDAGLVKSLVASTSLVPFLSWRHQRLWWSVGLGARVGLARLSGVPSGDDTESGNVVKGPWYGPLTRVTIGLDYSHLRISLGIEAGFSFAAVVGHTPQKDVAVDQFWLRPNFLLGFVF